MNKKIGKTKVIKSALKLIAKVENLKEFKLEDLAENLGCKISVLKSLYSNELNLLLELREEVYVQLCKYILLEFEELSIIEQSFYLYYYRITEFLFSNNQYIKLFLDIDGDNNLKSDMAYEDISDKLENYIVNLFRKSYSFNINRDDLLNIMSVTHNYIFNQIYLYFTNNKNIKDELKNQINIVNECNKLTDLLVSVIIKNYPDVDDIKLDEKQEIKSNSNCSENIDQDDANKKELNSLNKLLKKTQYKITNIFLTLNKLKKRVNKREKEYFNDLNIKPDSITEIKIHKNELEDHNIKNTIEANKNERDASEENLEKILTKVTELMSDSKFAMSLKILNSGLECINEYYLKQVDFSILKCFYEMNDFNNTKEKVYEILSKSYKLNEEDKEYLKKIMLFLKKDSN